MNEKFTFFLTGPLSQWYGPLRDRKTGKVKDDSRFVVDGTEYNSSEQYMMAGKAKLFNDAAALDEIMVATHPRDHQSIGRMVYGFDQEVWDKNARNIVYKGNYAKFTQNAHLLPFLLETEGTTLVEVNPKDKVWGIGLSEDDPRSLSRDTWQGTNWLGEILTTLRGDLL